MIINTDVKGCGLRSNKIQNKLAFLSPCKMGMATADRKLLTALHHTLMS